VSLFGRYRRHPASGSGSWADKGEPLDAGRWTILRANGVHLGYQNAHRQIATHHGFRDFYRAAVPGTTFTDDPEPQDIVREFNRKSGGAFADLGKHFFHPSPLPDASASFTRLGTLYLRARWEVEGAYTVGAVFSIAPGEQGPHQATAPASAKTHRTGAGFASLELSIVLTPSMLQRVTHVPATGSAGDTSPLQRGELYMARLFFGAYCSSGSNTAGQRASVVDITVRYAP